MVMTWQSPPYSHHPYPSYKKTDHDQNLLSHAHELFAIVLPVFPKWQWDKQGTSNFWFWNALRHKPLAGLVIALPWKWGSNADAFGSQQKSLQWVFPGAKCISDATPVGLSVEMEQVHMSEHWSWTFVHRLLIIITLMGVVNTGEFSRVLRSYDVLYICLWKCSLSALSIHHNINCHMEQTLQVGPSVM